MKTLYFVLIALLFSLTFSFCTSNKQLNIQKNTPSVKSEKPVGVWTTTGDMTRLLHFSTADFVSAPDDKYPIISIDTSARLQTIDGFGYTLTSGSILLFKGLNPTEREKLFRELFSNDSNAIGISYLRIGIGASDLSSDVYSYHDIEKGALDTEFKQFNLSKDSLDLISTLKEILRINPKIKILATPWSPPIWMKTNRNSIGGHLNQAFYEHYARYLAKYIHIMAAYGIKIEAMTLQNEPHHGGNNPSMILTAQEAINFVKNHLGPLFKKENIKTKIIVWDHNCDEPDYPITVLNDTEARQYIDGTAFHLYGGDINALSTVYASHPDKNIYFTEQWTGAKGDFKGDFLWHMRNVIIGSMRHYSRTALEWNLANDANYSIHTEGGCTECKGALTIDNQSVTRNVSYYIIAQISKFVSQGSVRLYSTQSNPIHNVAFERPDGKKVILLLNDTETTQTININFSGKWLTAQLLPSSASTYIW